MLIGDDLTRDPARRRAAPIHRIPIVLPLDAPLPVKHVDEDGVVHVHPLARPPVQRQMQGLAGLQDRPVQGVAEECGVFAQMGLHWERHVRWRGELTGHVDVPQPVEPEATRQGRRWRQAEIHREQIVSLFETGISTVREHQPGPWLSDQVGLQVVQTAGVMGRPHQRQEVVEPFEDVAASAERALPQSAIQIDGRPVHFLGLMEYVGQA